MTNFNAIRMSVVVLLGAALCYAAEDKESAKQPASPAQRGELAPPPAGSGAFFSTNAAGGPVKGSPFSAEISADFIKKVMETSARIEECKKQIAERQAYLFESNPKIKELRAELINMQKKINEILIDDKELAELRMSRDILWTTMPVLPKPPREQQPGMPGMPGMRGQIGR